MDVINISRASELYRSKDYAGFMKYCLSFDKIEDGDTLDSMGICYRDGKGVTKDINKAISYLENAVAHKCLDASVRLGSIYRTNSSVKNIEKAIYWNKLAADHGDAFGMYNLAIIYRREDSVKDMKKALGWYEKAAENGIPDAMYFLGWWYKHEAEPIDIELSIYWYEEAANKGYTDALVGLGSTYASVESVKDNSKALHYYKLAASQGNSDGKFYYAKLALTEKIFDDIIFQYLYEAAVSKKPYAKNAADLLTYNTILRQTGAAEFYLGKYYMGQPSSEFKESALKLYRAAAMKGYIPAQNMLLIIQSESTFQTVKEIKTDTSVIIETTADNSRKLDAISNSLLSMNEKIAEIKATSFTGNAETEDSEISSAIEKSAAVINNAVKDSPADKLNKEAEHLVRLFGEATWKRLLPETQQSLISSAYLLKECEGMPPDFDYSGICITAVVALEKELKRLFSDNYIKYLKEVRKDEDDQLPYLFQDKNYFFSLGKMAALFGYDVENDEIKYNFYARRMEEYLKTIVKKLYSYDPLLAFIEKDDPNCFVFRCLTINKTYRCKAAHCGNVSYDDAVDCCYEIYGEASAHIDAKRQSAEIISLLRDLYSKLK